MGRQSARRVHLYLVTRESEISATGLSNFAIQLQPCPHFLIPVLLSRPTHQCCEQVLFTTLLDQNSNKKWHRTKSLWYICSKWHKRERS